MEGLLCEMSREKKVVRAEAERVSDDMSKRRKVDTYAGELAIGSR